jgi:hypothetical protein
MTLQCSKGKRLRSLSFTACVCVSELLEAPAPWSKARMMKTERKVREKKKKSRKIHPQDTMEGCTHQLPQDTIT